MALGCTQAEYDAKICPRLSNYSIVISMRANPEPENSAFDVYAKCSMVIPTRTDQEALSFLKCREG